MLLSFLFLPFEAGAFLSSYSLLIMKQRGSLFCSAREGHHEMQYHALPSPSQMVCDFVKPGHAFEQR